MADYLEVNDFDSKSSGKSPKNFYRGISLAEKYTYADYLTWDDDVRYELLDGVPYMMASPSERHQWIVYNIMRQLGDQLENKPCVPYVAPLDVRLFQNEENSDTTVLQPDIFIVCDESKIKGLNYCKGPPNLIIEISSPTTENNDFVKKRFLYEKAGVPEYWVVSPNRVYVYTLDGKVYSEEVFLFNNSNIIEFKTLEDLYIDFSDISRRYPNEDE